MVSASSWVREASVVDTEMSPHSAVAALDCDLDALHCGQGVGQGGGVPERGLTGGVRTRCTPLLLDVLGHHLLGRQGRGPRRGRDGHVLGESVRAVRGYRHQVHRRESLSHAVGVGVERIGENVDDVIVLKIVLGERHPVLGDGEGDRRGGRRDALVSGGRLGGSRRGLGGGGLSAGLLGRLRGLPRGAGCFRTGVVLGLGARRQGGRQEYGCDGGGCAVKSLHNHLLVLRRGDFHILP